MSEMHCSLKLLFSYGPFQPIIMSFYCHNHVNDYSLPVIGRKRSNFHIIRQGNWEVPGNVCMLLRYLIFIFTCWNWLKIIQLHLSHRKRISAIEKRSLSNKYKNAPSEVKHALFAVNSMPWNILVANTTKTDNQQIHIICFKYI